MNEIKELTEKDFSLFGKILTIKSATTGENEKSHLWYPEKAVIEIETSVNLMEVLPGEMICRTFEAHNNTDEILFPLDGDIIIACVPAGVPDRGKMEAFRVRQGEGVSFNAGTWHHVPFPAEKAVKCVVIFKKGTSSNDIYFKDMDEPVQII